MVGGLTPARHHKLLAHIRKSSERQRKRKTEKNDLSDSEEEEEEEGKVKKVGSWIRESSSGDDPVDFLDTSLAGRISCEGSLSSLYLLHCLSLSQPRTLRRCGLR